MIADLLYCKLARLARPISFIDSPWRHVFVLIRWLLYTQYPNGWLLYPLPLHLSYLPIRPLIVVYYIIAILRHGICPVITYLVDLLFWYLHLNYKPIFNTHQLFIPIIWNDYSPPHVKLQNFNCKMFRRFSAISISFCSADSPTTTQYW